MWCVFKGHLKDKSQRLGNPGDLAARAEETRQTNIQVDNKKSLVFKKLQESGPVFFFQGNQLIFNILRNGQ